MKPKRTIEELAKIEHALKEKYGEDSIVNPRQFWTKEKESEYQKELSVSVEKQQKLEENSEKIEKDGFLISKRLLTYTNSEGCPTCSKYFLNAQDTVYLIKFECCHKCFIDFVDGREDRWKTGWRPTK